MIPIKNKKKTLEVTVTEMTNFALNYVEKFAPSKSELVMQAAETLPNKLMEKIFDHYSD